MKFGHKTSDFSPRFSLQPSAFRLRLDAEELVKILVARCKKLNQETDSKDGVKNEEMEIW
jgi:hypothetical protein